MSLPALPVTADTRSITERVNVLIRDYNTLLRVPSGCVMPFAGGTPPDGWLLCYGQAVSRTTYSDLFAAIATTYGAGDGTNFNNNPATNNAFTGITIANAGGGGAHNNTQPTIILNHILST